MTAQEPVTWIGRWRFTLGELLVSIAILALGLVVVRTRGGDWSQGGLFVVSIALAIGMCQQSRAIRRQLCIREHMPADILAAWGIAVLWRWVVSAAIAGYWTLEQLSEGHWILLKQHSNDGTWFGVLLLCLLFSLSATPWGMPRPVSSSRSRRMVSLFSLVVATVILCWMVRELTVIPSMVHQAIRGAINGFCAPPTQQQVFRFIGLAGTSLAGSLLGVWLLLGLAPRLRRAWSSILAQVVIAVCLLTTVAYVAWVRGWGLYGVSPAEAGNALKRPWDSWLGVGVLLFVVSAALAYRPCVTGEARREDRPLMWRCGRDNYWSEHPSVLILSFLTCAGCLLRDFLALNGILDDPCDALLYTSTMPRNLGLLGLACLSARGLFGCRNCVGEKALQASTSVRLGRLVWRWICLAVFMAGAVEAIMWLGFGMSALVR